MLLVLSSTALPPPAAATAAHAGTDPQVCALETQHTASLRGRGTTLLLRDVRDHAAAEGCGIQRGGLCLACLSATATASSILGVAYPKPHGHHVMEVQGFLCREVKVGIDE